MATTQKEDAYKLLEGFDVNSKAADVHRISQFSQADSKHGVYEVGLMESGAFRAYYLGKAARQTLNVRLGQHFKESSNKEIERQKKAGAILFFRCTPVDFGNATLPAIDIIEGLYLAAFKEKYTWNRRQEWTQHFAVEDM
jgi:hypothetical protein